MAICFKDYTSGIQLPDCSKLATNQKNNNDVIMYHLNVTVKFFNEVLFLLSSLVTDPSFTSISSLFLELWKFSFIRDWPQIWKLEIPAPGFCLISGDWGKLGILNLTRMSLIKYYRMLKNARVTDFTVSEFLRENQEMGGGGERGLVKLPPLHPD